MPIKGADSSSDLKGKVLGFEGLLELVYEYIRTILSGITPWQWGVVSLNILLLILAPKILSRITHGDAESRTDNLVKVFRAVNALILVLILSSNIGQGHVDRSLISKLVSSSMALYIGYLSFLVYAYLINARFGVTRQVEDKTVTVETYNSRALRLLGGILIFVVTLISIIQIFGLNGLMEAGGVVGFLGVMLALTQGAWAPDIISGLIILNSNVVKEGDVVEIEHGGSSVVASIFRIKLFHIEILDLVSNHRIMIRNARFRDLTMHNLSRFASAKGLREKLTFNIGYECPPQIVEEMFDKVFEDANVSGEIKISDQHPVEVRVLDTGDYAVKWGVFYYTKEIRDLIATRQHLLKKIFVESERRNISLATPQLQDVVALPKNRSAQMGL